MQSLGHPPRFATTDPVCPRKTNPQLQNRYSYVANDPIDHRDVDGRDPFGGPCDSTFDFCCCDPFFGCDCCDTFDPMCGGGDGGGGDGGGGGGGGGGCGEDCGLLYTQCLATNQAIYNANVASANAEFRSCVEGCVLTGPGFFHCVAICAAIWAAERSADYLAYTEGISICDVRNACCQRGLDFNTCNPCN